MDYGTWMSVWLASAGLQRVARRLDQLTPQFPQRFMDFVHHSSPPLECAPPRLPAPPGYRRMSRKTPNRDVATSFGRITLRRRGYRSWDRDDGEPLRFPLEEQLGLVAKTTPLMAGIIARRMPEAGSTQRSTLEWLKRAHGLSFWHGSPARLVPTSLRVGGTATGEHSGATTARVAEASTRYARATQTGAGGRP